MAKYNFENPRANEKPYINHEFGLNDFEHLMMTVITKSRHLLARLILISKAWLLYKSFNIQIINSKLDALTAVLSESNKNDIKFDAICLQETWLSIDQDTALFIILRYQLISQGKSCSCHSGLMIFFSNEYSYLITSSHNNSQLWDGICVEVSGKSLWKNHNWKYVQTSSFKW